MSVCVKLSSDYLLFKGKKTHYIVHSDYNWLTDLASLERFLRPGVEIEAWCETNRTKMTHVVE